MKIHNTTTYFLDHYVPTEVFLRSYYEKFPESFKEYFLYHCRNPDQKIPAAIKKYPVKFEDMRQSSQNIERLIHQTVDAYRQKYGITFTEDVHIIIGAFGSNAFTHRQIIPEITFCLEQLSSKEANLQVIIAHEFGHALHNAISAQEGMDWEKLDWGHPYTWLLQEGCATYFSRQIVKADEAVYFSYDENGENWLQFVKDNKQAVLSAFIQDMEMSSDIEIFHEWFSINGGQRFGYTRLAYFIAYVVFENLARKYGDVKAVTLWNKGDFHAYVEHELLELQHANLD